MQYHPTVGRIEELLHQRGISYEKFEHEAVRTSEEAAAIRPGYTLSQGAKALIIRVKGKLGKSFAMVVVPGDSKFNSAKVKEALGASDIRFATPEEVGEITGGVLPGGVPPFGILWNLLVLVDVGLSANDTIIFNAGDRSVSIALRFSDYREVVAPMVRDIC